MTKQDNTKKKQGLIIMILGLVSFFIFMNIFGLMGSIPQHRSVFYVMKEIFSVSFLPLGLYFGLYLSHGKKLATQLGGALALMLIVGYVLGFLLH